MTVKFPKSPGNPRATWIVLGIFFLGYAGAQTAVYEPEQSYFGRNGYVEYRAGNLPLILTSGHNGALTPDEIPDRTWGVTVTDTNTLPLTEAMAAEIVSRTGKFPHVIINHLRRTKLDPNREIGEAAQGNEFAEQAWKEYHGYIEDARKLAEAEFGFGFVTDIHGHGHDIQRIELGYGLGNPELNLSNEQLEDPGFGWNSSLRTLVLRRPGTSFPDLLRGPRSLGDLLNDRGIPSWPSSEYPSPDGAPFFSGGYTTRRHTCFIDNGPINGVQIEAHWNGIRNSAANRSSFAANFSRVMQPYLYENYGFPLGTLPLHRLHTDTREMAKGGYPVSFQVVREGYVSFTEGIHVEFSGTAIYGVDFLVSNSIVSFSSGQTVGSFSLLPLSPNGDLGDKTIEVRLAPTYRQTVHPEAITITLGDGISQTVRIEAKKPSVSEGEGQAVFQLRRTSTAEALEVNLEWDGTAVAGLDFDFPWELPESILFPIGEGKVEVTVNLIDDVIPEPDKDIILRVLPGVGYEVGHHGEAKIQLIDDDRPEGIAIWLRGEVEGNRLLDSSGYGRHATGIPAGRGPSSVTTDQGQSIIFDGVDATAALPKVTLDSEAGFSVAFHFRIQPSSSTNQHNLVSLGARGGAGSLNVYLSATSTLRTWLGTSTASSLDATGAWTDGEWRHYGLTVDASGMRRVFVDGRAVRSSGGWNPPLDPDEILWLGWRRGNGEAKDFFGGEIKDFRAYHRALAPSEVTALALGRLSFDAWRRKHDLPVGESPLADLDGDGLNLLLEYGLGANPTLPGRAPRYETRISGDRLILDFIHQASARDLNWRVEATSDPNLPWETLAERSANALAWSLAPGVALDEKDGLISVTDNYPASDSGSSKRLMRLHLELAQ